MLVRGSCLVVIGLLATVVIGAPPPVPQPQSPPLPPPQPPASLSVAHADANQIVLQVGGVESDNDIHEDSPRRKLHGRFLHITGLSPTPTPTPTCASRLPLPGFGNPASQSEYVICQSYYTHTYTHTPLSRHYLVSI